MSEDTHLLEEIRDLLRAQNALLEKLVAKAPAPAAGASGHTGWKAALVPSWARYDSGIPLGDLSLKALEFWFRWQPKPNPRTNKLSGDDIALRKALDEAQAEINAGTYTPPQYTKKPRDPSAPPRQQRGAPPADEPANDAPPPDINDEDVPF